MEKLIISSSPHIRSKTTTRRIMIDVIIALLPCAAASVVFFGAYSLALMAISVSTCVATELVYSIVLRKAWRDWKKTIKHIFEVFDFTSVVTGLILSLLLPVTTGSGAQQILTPWYYPLLGGIFAIAICKMLFGGTGRNLVNPACAGRVFLFISFMSVLTSNVGNCVIAPIQTPMNADLLTSATPLTNLIAGKQTLSLIDLLLGTGLDGAAGETCKVAILAGYLYLCLRKVIKWYYPLLCIGSSALLAFMLEGFDFSFILPSVLSGGLMFGAVFMATDYCTNPKSTLGNIIFFISLGLLNAGLRKATGIEVTSFCILIMNCITPLIDIYLPRRPFGFVKPTKEVKAQ